jgi:hypothetical protein
MTMGKSFKRPDLQRALIAGNGLPKVLRPVAGRHVRVSVAQVVLSHGPFRREVLFCADPQRRLKGLNGLAKEVHKPLKGPSDFPRRRLSPAAPE